MRDRTLLVVAGVGTLAVVGTILVVERLRPATQRVNSSPNASMTAGGGALGWNIPTLNALFTGAAGVLKSYPSGAQKPTSYTDMASGGTPQN